MEQQLGESFDEWPLREWNYSRLTLAAWYFDPRLESARQTWPEANVKSARDTTTDAPQPDQKPSGLLSAAIPPMPLYPGARDATQAQPGLELRSVGGLEWRTEPRRVRLQSLAWVIRARVRSNLFDYVFLDRNEAMLEQLETTKTKLVQSAKLRVSVGLMPREAIAQLRLQLDQTRLQLIQTRLEKMDSRERLAHALGLPVNALFDIEIKQNFLSGADHAWNVHDLRRNVLRRRPDLSDALIGYAAAEATVRAEVAGISPHLELPASCWWDARQNRWVVRLDKWLPAEERRDADIARAEDRRVEAAVRLLQLQSDILDGLERQAALYRISAEELGSVDELANSSRVHHELTKIRYQAGIVAAPELLAARGQWIAARIKQLNAQVRLQQALGALEDVMQIPFEQVRDLQPSPETQ